MLEYAVKMRRLPENASLLSYFDQDELSPELLTTLAERLAAFHKHAESGPQRRGVWAV